ncbi:MAG: SDR family oxidoreductase, partial [Burkholderiales bacterium]|nr:SDR family oxidoreductase [Anaerolineae bacterium]
IITGGAQGLGYGSAQVLAGAGARVFIFDLQEQQAQEAAASLPGTGHIGYRCDITNADERAQTVAAAFAEAGHLDILVNNAGIQYHSPAEDIDEEKWYRLFDINVHSVLFMSRDVGRHMLAQGSGAIINIGSIASVLSMPRRAPYVTAKTAILGLTRTLAVEWAGRGVRVNAVCPGYHETPMLMDYINRGAIDAERIRKRIPMGRMGTIEDVGKAVLFFASDLSAYVTGQHLLIDGGYTVFGAAEDAS